MMRWMYGVAAIALVAGLGGWVMSHNQPQKAEEKQQREEFASQRDPALAPVLPFNAKRAMDYLETICKIGPRISGTDGMKRQQELLEKHFKDLGGKIEYQRFTARQPSQRSPVEMANLIVSWFPERTRRVILCSHYDTRPIADQEADQRRWRAPFVSANDGGSGVALLMEMAHQMKDLKTEVGVDFVFFDGEEYINDPRPNTDRYFLGSEYFGMAYKRGFPRHKFLAAILLDMVGGKDARFPLDPVSSIRAGALQESVWKLAAQLNCRAFETKPGRDVLDDHVALNDAGIPAIDIIDFDYQHWHQLTDVPANCSADSLEQVARVLGVWLQRVK